jgi:DNA-binding XRE family transcriptional regulator
VTKKLKSFDDWLNAKMEEPEFKKEWEESELEYQLQRQLIKKLIEKRKQKSMTQENLAEKLSTSQAALAKLEGDKYNVTLGKIEEVARALGCQIRFELIDIPGVTFEDTSPS